MLKLIIEDDEGRRTVVPFVRQEITIGRQEGNTIRLTERNVSRHHARLVRQNGTIVVEDLGSYNGVRVNGERIGGPAALREGDRVQIGDYELAIDDDSVQKSARTTTRELERPPMGAAPVRGAAPAQPLPTPASEAQPSPVRASPRLRYPAEIDPRQAPRLVVVNTELAGREFACARTELKIGRSNDNDIALDHASLSGTHARLLRDSSGDWQIIDLQSSNGVFVNGEAFGKARLRDGDLLELGEVKLKFVAPESAHPAMNAPRARSFGSWVRRSAMGALVLLLAAGGAYSLLGKGGAPPPPEERPAAVASEEKAAPAATQQAESAKSPAEVAQEAAAAPAPVIRDHPAAAAPVSRPPQLDSKLRAANAAMKKRDFQKAVEILESIKSSDGSRPSEVDDPLYRANLELAAKKKLGLAQKSLSAGRVDQAVRLLKESSGTVAYAKEHEQLAARADALRRPASRTTNKEVQVAEAAKPPSPEAEEERPSPPTPQDEAQRLYEEGTSLYRNGQFADAASTLNQCLRVNPTFAKCHLVLGSTYAKLKEPELGAQHYRRFLQLAPDDPDANKVKIFLEQYDSTRGPNR